MPNHVHAVVFILGPREVGAQGVGPRPYTHAAVGPYDAHAAVSPFRRAPAFPDAIIPAARQQE
jgi:hypothetical protein